MPDVQSRSKLRAILVAVFIVLICVALLITMVILATTGYLDPSSSARVKAMSKFKAAVYEHAVFLPNHTATPVSRAEALRHMQVNLDVYARQASVARSKNVNIIVFPEDGLYGFLFTRDTVRPYLEFVPDPEEVTWCACDDPGRFPDTEVQRQLSCMAKHNALYLVANMGSVQTCEHSSTDLSCPPDGRLQYNTAVAFDPAGKLVGRYRKRNLYKEDQFDRPPVEVKYFDTPFGRFGLFVCFDILFRSPALDMIEHHGIRNVAFSTAWMDALPVLSAIGWHSSFAKGQRVNLLAANIHLPSYRLQGSGIYTPKGAVSYYYDRDSDSSSKLIIDELDVLSGDDSQSDERTGSADVIGMTSKTGDIPPPPIVPSPGGFQNKGFNFVALTEQNGTATVCQKELCCTLEYSFHQHPGDLVVLGALNGLFRKKFSSQICTLLVCPDNDRSQCGSYTYSSGTSLRQARLRASGVGHARPAFPQVVLTQNGTLRLTHPDDWSWSPESTTLNLHTRREIPLLVMAIVARDYAGDQVVF